MARVSDEDEPRFAGMNGFGGCSVVGVVRSKGVAGGRRGRQNAGWFGWNVVIGRSDLFNDVPSSRLDFTCGCRCSGGCWSPPTGSVPEVCRPLGQWVQNGSSGVELTEPLEAWPSSVTDSYQGWQSEFVRVPTAHQRQDAIWHYSPLFCPSSYPSWGPRWSPAWPLPLLPSPCPA